MLIIKEETPKDGYSFGTSMPAYEENQFTNAAQQDVVLKVIEDLVKNDISGQCCLKQIQEKLNHLPASTISGRINDLKRLNKIEHTGETMNYKDRKRKVIKLVEPSKGDSTKKAN